MEFKLKNDDIVTVIGAMEKVAPKSMKVNRGRAKFIKHLAKKLEEYIADEKDILKDYAELDENGEFVRVDGNIKLKNADDTKEVNELLIELANEIITIKSGEYANRYKVLFEYLLDCEFEFDTKEIIALDDLLEQYENAKGENQC